MLEVDIALSVVKEDLDTFFEILAFVIHKPQFGI